MTTVQYVLMVLLSLPSAGYDTESSEGREVRMEVVAQAIGEASARATCQGRFEVDKCERVWPGGQKDLALMLITKGWWESRMAQNVHEGKCRKNECDATTIKGVTVHRARTIWQMQKTGLLEPGEWETMVGTDFKSTRTAAWAAARILSRGKRVCHSAYGTLSFYARSRCSWSGARTRVLFYQKLKDKSHEQFEADVERRLNRHVTFTGGKSSP